MALGFAAIAAAVGVLLVVLVAVLAALVAARARGRRVEGGASERARLIGDARAAAHRASENVVVDTLNLLHALQGPEKRKPTLCGILETIEATAPALRAQYPGRVVFVLKSRDHGAPDPAAREAYKNAARRCGVYVDLVERSPAAPGRASSAAAPHAAKGRDDFYLVMLAHKYRCAVLTRDRFRDLPEMKVDLPTFAVYRWDPTGRQTRDYVTPSAPELLRLPRPARVDPADAFPGRVPPEFA